MRLLDLLASFSFSLFFFYFFFVFIPIRLCRRLKGSGGGDGKYRNSRLSARACGSNGPFRFLELAYRIISPLSDSSTAVTWFWWVACLPSSSSPAFSLLRHAVCLLGCRTLPTTTSTRKTSNKTTASSSRGGGTQARNAPSHKGAHDWVTNSGVGHFPFYR